jgi:hypothetical protein
MAVSPSASLQADVAIRDFSDGNGSRDLYVQYQRTLTRGTAWIALQPNVYWEQWQVTTPAYYSPAHHVTLATTLRTIATSGNWTLDATVTPQALVSQGRTGAGMTLANSLTRRLGGGALGGNVMWFTDRRYRYQLWRVTGEVRLPLTK